ncbi:MAG: hypothetical protein ACFCU7_19810 [Pleurocapsa sp.]
MNVCVERRVQFFTTPFKMYIIDYSFTGIFGTKAIANFSTGSDRFGDF